MAHTATAGANAPGLDDIALSGIGDIAALDAALLADLQRQADARVEDAKALQARLSAAIARRYDDRIRSIRALERKDTGRISFDDGAITVSVDAAKRVDWDQDAIGAIVASIRASGEDPADYVEIAYKVAERKFSAWPSNIRAAFEAARTVKAGAQKITLGAEVGS